MGCVPNLKVMGSKPEINYPCEWSYAIIGLDEESMKVAVSKIIKGKKYEIKFSRKSKKGKYTSLNVNAYVKDEQERNNIYRNLKESPQIRIVL